jgi:hypothetical protein
MVPNTVPANTTVEASSAEEAIAKAGAGAGNATAGTGDWTVTLEIGAAAFGRIRPSGGISYSIEVRTEGFQGKATKI